MSSIFTYLAKRIVVDLSPSRFIFSIKEKDVNISFAPFLYLEKGEEMWMPVAIGEDVPSNQRNNPNVYKIGIDDFMNKPPSELILQSEAFLQLLFEYGIGKCFEGFWFPQLRPVVFIVGVNRFSEYFEHPKELFELVAKRGGAHLVLFDKADL